MALRGWVRFKGAFAHTDPCHQQSRLQSFVQAGEAGIQPTSASRTTSVASCASSPLAGGRAAAAAVSRCPSTASGS